MSTIPIIAQHRVEPTPGQLADVERLAEELRRERPELGLKEEFRPLLPRVLGGAPTLHLDDLSEIPMLDRDGSLLFMQERACLRRRGRSHGLQRFAGNRVRILCPRPARTGLGRVAQPTASPQRPAPASIRLLGGPGHPAPACPLAPAGRTDLSPPPHGDLLGLGPGGAVHRASRRPVKVIAPPPGVARWANHKETFAETVTRLFGPAWRPRFAAAANYATLSHWVAVLAAASRVLVLKLPDSAGGRGNVVLDAAPFRRMPLRDPQGA